MPCLCTPEASVNVLPSVLYLLTCTLREVASIRDSSSQKTVSVVLQALKQLTTSPFTQHQKCSKDWIDLLQRYNFYFLSYNSSLFYLVQISVRDLKKVDFFFLLGLKATNYFNHFIQSILDFGFLKCTTMYMGAVG